MRRVLITFVLVASGLVLAATPALAGTVAIHEIYYNSPGSDGGSNSSLNAEWIQLHNVTKGGVSLTGWTIRDVAGHVYKFGSYTLGAGRYVKIHTGKGTNTSTDRYWGSGWYIWNNDKDTAYLKGPQGGTIDTCSYNNASASYRFC